ncbi:MAG: hypothetical protein ABUS54_12765, partial [Actinomycetota bacterium]
AAGGATRRMSAGWRDVWDFDDLELSERRFRARLEEGGDRAALLTQLARIEGLRGDFAAGERLLAEAEAAGGAEPWVLIERGRLLRSGGDAPAALPLFEASFELALAAGDGFLAGDAAHMAALAGDVEAWTARGLELADSGGYWRAPLLNNLGWSRFDGGDFEGALAAFREALAVRSEDPVEPHEREIARYAVAKALRALGRIDEAIAELERSVAWATDAGVATPLIDEALDECYAAAGRPARARTPREAGPGRLLEPPA